MNRRGFLQIVGTSIAAISVGINLVPQHRKLKAKWSEEMERDLQGMQGFTIDKFCETGYFYAPYIPFHTTSLMS